MGCGTSKQAQVLPGAPAPVPCDGTKLSPSVAEGTDSERLHIQSAVINQFLEDQVAASADVDPAQAGWSAAGGEHMDPILEESQPQAALGPEHASGGASLDLADISAVPSSSQDSNSAGTSAVSLSFLVDTMLPIAERMMEERSLHDVTVAEFVEWHINPSTGGKSRCVAVPRPGSWIMQD
jgi:hypothetical protein